jgi:anti-sigma factor RsiW
MSRHRRSGPARPRDCRTQLSALFAYLDGELSPAQCRAIERHLADCTCCGGLAAGVREAIAACRAVGAARIPAGVQRKARIAARRLVRPR